MAAEQKQSLLRGGGGGDTEAPPAYANGRPTLFDQTARLAAPGSGWAMLFTVVFALHCLFNIVVGGIAIGFLFGVSSFTKEQIFWSWVFFAIEFIFLVVHTLLGGAWHLMPRWFLGLPPSTRMPAKSAVVLANTVPFYVAHVGMFLLVGALFTNIYFPLAPGEVVEQFSVKYWRYASALLLVVFQGYLSISPLVYGRMYFWHAASYVYLGMTFSPIVGKSFFMREFGEEFVSASFMREDAAVKALTNPAVSTVNVADLTLPVGRQFTLPSAGGAPKTGAGTQLAFGRSWAAPQ